MRSEESSKKFLELKRKEIKASKTTRKMWQKKVSRLMTSPSSNDNQTQGVESPAQDSKPELSPRDNSVVIISLHLHIGKFISLHNLFDFIMACLNFCKVHFYFSNFCFDYIA
jgi:hypothetical protein